jgi:hypothetical protein
MRRSAAVVHCRPHRACLRAAAVPPPTSVMKSRRRSAFPKAHEKARDQALGPTLQPGYSTDLRLFEWGSAIKFAV